MGSNTSDAPLTHLKWSSKIKHNIGIAPRRRGCVRGVSERCQGSASALGAATAQITRQSAQNAVRALSEPCQSALGAPSAL